MVYAGFRFVGLLRSIYEQRRAQARMIADLAPESMISSGCGDGEELSMFFRWRALASVRVLEAVDLDDTESLLASSPLARSPGSRLKFVRGDISSRSRAGARVDLNQCGFVMHEIPFHRKRSALRAIRDSVVPGGYVVLSDMFLGEDSSVEDGAAELYEHFLEEAEDAVARGRLTRRGWRELVGDGKGPGLRHSARVAAHEDFLETSDVLCERAGTVGLELVRREHNPIEPRLEVHLYWRGPALRRNTNNEGRGTDVLV